MANYEPTDWKDTVKDAQGNVIQKGTPLNASTMKKIEDGIVNTDKRVDDVTTQLADVPNQSLIIETPTSVKFVAHRGLNDIAPENSIPAFREAGIAGFWSAECDIQRTSDGVWVVMHDKTVDRTTNGTGNVKDMTLAQIKSLNIDVGNNIGLYPNLKVPTLEEYLNVCKQYGMVPMIEIKSDFLASDYPSFIEILRKTNYEEKAIVICFDLLILWEIRKLTKKTTVQYIAPISEVSLMHVKNMGNAQIDPDFNTVTKELVDLAHSKGISVNTWAVDSYDTATTMISYGVDMISSNRISNVSFL